MSSNRPLTGLYRSFLNNQPLANALIKIRLSKNDYDLEAGYPVFEYEIRTTETGHLPEGTTIWQTARGLDGAKAVFVEPDGFKWEAVVPMGDAPISVQELRANGTIIPPPETLLALIANTGLEGLRDISFDDLQDGDAVVWDAENEQFINRPDQGKSFSFLSNGNVKLVGNDLIIERFGAVTFSNVQTLSEGDLGGDSKDGAWSVWVVPMFGTSEGIAANSFNDYEGVIPDGDGVSGVYTWGESEGATGYEIYRSYYDDLQGSFLTTLFLGEITATTFTDDGSIVGVERDLTANPFRENSRGISAFNSFSGNEESVIDAAFSAAFRVDATETLAYAAQGLANNAQSTSTAANSNASNAQNDVNKIKIAKKTSYINQTATIDLNAFEQFQFFVIDGTASIVTLDALPIGKTAHFLFFGAGCSLIFRDGNSFTQVFDNDAGSQGFYVSGNNSLKGIKYTSNSPSCVLTVMKTNTQHYFIINKRGTFTVISGV